MLTISDADKAKYESGQYNKEIKLTFVDMHIELTNEDVYGESMTLEQGIFDGNGALVIGGCISSRFSIEIRNPGIAYSFIGEEIEVSLSIDGGADLVIFHGYVESVETVRDRSYQKLQCYDVLQSFASENFYETYANLTFPTTLGTIRSALVGFMGLTEAETYSLINDDISIDQTITSNEINALDALKAICEANGVFGRINASGELEYIDIATGSAYLPYPSDEIYPSADFYPSTESGNSAEYIDVYKSITYEDYTVQPIDSVTVRDSSSDTEEAKVGSSYANTLLIEGNMWFNSIVELYKTTIARRLLNKLKYIEYIPFESTIRGLPWIEVGDAVTEYVYDYSTGTPVTYVMTFSVLKRYLKGIQWLEDTYSASGDMWQPRIKYENKGGGNSQLESEVNTLKDEVDAFQSGKQNFIDNDILEPTGTWEEGDLVFYSNLGDNFKRLYRYESGAWVQVGFCQYSTTDLTAGSSALNEGEVYLVYE